MIKCYYIYIKKSIAIYEKKQDISKESLKMCPAEIVSFVGINSCTVNGYDIPVDNTLKKNGRRFSVSISSHCSKENRFCCKNIQVTSLLVGFLVWSLENFSTLGCQAPSG